MMLGCVTCLQMKVLFLPPPPPYPSIKTEKSEREAKSPSNAEGNCLPNDNQAIVEQRREWEREKMIIMMKYTFDEFSSTLLLLVISYGMRLEDREKEKERPQSQRHLKLYIPSSVEKASSLSPCLRDKIDLVLEASQQ